MPLLQVLNALGNIAIFAVAIYVRFQINKLETKILHDDVQMEEKILKIVNGKYLKTELYTMAHTNLIEKVDSVRNDVSKLCDKIDKFIDRIESDTKANEAKHDAYEKSVEKKLIKLAGIPCPFQEKKKFLLEED